MYDAAIVSWFDQGAAGGLPATLDLPLERAQELRYGENPHQHGARYRQLGVHSWWDDVQQHAGLARRRLGGRIVGRRVAAAEDTSWSRLSGADR